ncbi:MAG: bifunctional phosphoglucose/phosphomannose isomerase [Sulfolobales archaeon]
MRRILEDYVNWSFQLERALNYEVADAQALDVSTLSGIAFVGMGGSGIVGDMLSKYFEREIDIPVVAIKSYVLPRYVNSEWLVIAVSYSGNTLETLSAFHEAIRRRAKVGVVASGGQLALLAERWRLPRVIVEKDHLPRTALPALLAGTLGLLSKLIELDVSLERGVEVLRDSSALNEAESLAKYLYGGIPVFVVSESYYPVGLRAKNEINENAKVASKVEVIPEWGHNDIVGWEGIPRNWLRVVAIKGDQDPAIDFALDYLRELGHDVRALEICRYGYLETVLYGSWLVGLASVFLAGLRGVDPEVTTSIEKYKEFMRSYLKVSQNRVL